MKAPLLFLLFIFISPLCYGQINFEEIETPDDFSLQIIRKSPVGEYFVQAIHDQGSIYTSMGGENWTKTPLPEEYTIEDINFFEDGTPILVSAYGPHIIRRNGTWHFMELPGEWDEIEASYIRGDTLFVYHRNHFAYSLDKGSTFDIAFVAEDNIIDHRANLWKSDNYYVLHHTAGAQGYLSVFTENGQYLFNEDLDLGAVQMGYNESCKEVLIYDISAYSLLSLEDLSIEHGSLQDIAPGYGYGNQILFQNDHYFLQLDNTLYKSDGCGFAWEPILGAPPIGLNNANIWIDREEQAYVYRPKNNRYFFHENANQQWSEEIINIDYSLTNRIDESSLGAQIALTENGRFTKTVSDLEWQELDEENTPIQLQYAPNGDLYLLNQGGFNQNEGILYSQDNGQNFDTIPLPVPDLLISFFNMHILDNGIILLLDGGLQSFYSVNNGQEWTPIDLQDYTFPGKSEAKLVGNDIIIAVLGYSTYTAKINIETNEISETPIEDISDSGSSGSIAILDDGTIFVLTMSFFTNNLPLIQRFRYGQTPEPLEESPEPPVGKLIASGVDLYLVNQDEYLKFDGESFVEHQYMGLPEQDYKQFILSGSQHLYAIIDQHHIYRSSAPLTSPKLITGTIHQDIDQNCTVDGPDIGLQYWKVRLENDDHLQIRTTDSEGQFALSVPEGNFTLSSEPVNESWTLCTSSFDLTVGEETTTVEQDFLAQATDDCANLSLDFSTPLLRRCFDNYYTVHVRNTGPSPSDASTLTIELDSFFVFSDATIPYTLINDYTLEFDLGQIPLNEDISFRIYFNLSCDAELGTEHCMSGNVVDSKTCVQAPHTYEECQENIGSYDPNDKRVFDENGRQVETLDKGEYLYYHVRFQNTGTDTAFTVRIVDTLAPELDLSTLEMLSASHPYRHQVIDGPTLEVTFDDILLPDSTVNEPASHGYFKFKVKPLPAYDYGTVIPNQAAIYFDFNDPIFTNVALLGIQQPNSTFSQTLRGKFDLFPNPATDELFLNLTDNLRTRVSTYQIINQLGQPVGTAHALPQNPINIAQLAPGVYQLVLRKNDAIVSVQLFVKM